MADFSQFFSGQPWGSWGSGAGQAPQPPMPQGPQVPPEVIAALRAKLGLDEPAEAQGAAEAAAARVRAPYAKANERQSGLPDIFNYYSNKLASAVTAPRDALTGAMQVTDPETGMPTREAMERGKEVANLAMTGGVPFAKQGAAGMAGGKLAKGEIKPVESPIMPTEYRGEHGAPGPDSGSPLHDVTANGTYPKDFYGPQGLRYYAPGHETLDADTYRKILMLKDKPDAMVPVWRAMPWDGNGKDPVTRSGSNINPGDWVTISRQYALDHGESALNGNFSLSKKMVPARELFTAGDSFHEWGWSPKEAGGPSASVGEPKTGTLSDFITAYHGSPHDFDRFDLSKIGTGEGAQAYGHGLYFAENEGVAKGYKEALTNRADPTYNFKGETIPHSDLLRRLQNNFDITGFAARRLLSDIQRGAPLQEMRAIGHSPGIKDAAAWLHNNGASANPMSEGKVYQVAIKAPPEHFLDWDKPLSEQSPKVREALQQYVGQRAELRNRFPGGGEGEMTGQHVITNLAAKRNQGMTEYDYEGATKALREAGIPGIKYLDQGSRAAPAQVEHLQRQISGLEDILRQSPEREDVQKALAGRRSELEQAQKTTRNYVVFDDKLIDILKKYGLAGLAALPAMNAYHYQDKGN